MDCISVCGVGSTGEGEDGPIPISWGRKSKATMLRNCTLENKSQPLELACQSSSSLISTLIHFSDLVPRSLPSSYAWASDLGQPWDKIQHTGDFKSGDLE